jgi:hypothetical protein
MDKNLNELVDAATEEITRKVSHLPEQMTPLGQKKLTKAEQVERYLEMRESPEKWLDLIGEHGMIETIEYAKRMEALYAATDALSASS